RYYDPEIGRLLSVDPVTADSNTGAMFNRYNYANSNPYKFTDPDGRQSNLAYIDRYLRHYFRNSNNKPYPTRQQAGDNDWIEMSEDESVFHRRGEGGEDNTKWIDETGHHEAVYDGDGNLVTDRLNGGTYNF